MTLRLTDAERAQLEEMAGAMTLSAYICACLFAKEDKRRKRRAGSVVDDEKALRSFGGRLSAEQRIALSDILGDRQFSCVVGLAGSGKSMMPETARQAWARQCVGAHGAALSGKAAEGLKNTSATEGGHWHG